MSLIIPPHQYTGRAIRALKGNSWNVPEGCIGEIIDVTLGTPTVGWNEPDDWDGVGDMYYYEYECSDADLEFVELLEDGSTA